MRGTRFVWLGGLLLAAACGGGGGSSGMGRVQVLVTDKRFDLDLVQEALVHVTKITLIPGDEDGDDDEGENEDGDHDGNQDDDDQGEDGDEGHEEGTGHEHHGHGTRSVVVYPGPGITGRLLVLRDGISAELTTGQVPAGRYRMARLFIDDAKLTLTNGNVYSTADGNLDLTCANTSGLKIFFDPPLDIA